MDYLILSLAQPPGQPLCVLTAELGGNSLQEKPCSVPGICAELCLSVLWVRLALEQREKHTRSAYKKEVVVFMVFTITE